MTIFNQACRYIGILLVGGWEEWILGMPLAISGMQTLILIMKNRKTSNIQPFACCESHCPMEEAGSKEHSQNSMHLSGDW